ncbi:MAG: FAD-dependent monooxygenase [Rhizobiales bacterium]|nr:FAD-dependent monooxygenase [Hyphomicrobiales bacterium]
MREFEIIVVGGGPAGLAAACRLARDGRRVALIGSTRSQRGDPRTVALMQPSIRLLADLGVWTNVLQSKAAPLRRLRMVDDTGAALQAPTIIFDPAEIGEEVFGWNIPLALLIPALHARALDLGVEIIAGDVTAARVLDNAIEVTAADGIFRAKVALAADGRKSVLRDAASIRSTAWDYEQTAIATSFDHSGEHDGVSSEYHRGAGPFTTVPMPGKRSSLVWLERPARAAELMALDDASLTVEVQIATHGDLGRITGIGPRRAFPMHGLTARSFAAKRTLLVGEAGHVAPPIGAQGLNMALRDGAEAAELMAGAIDPGADDILQDYDRLRRRDVLPRQQVIDLVNRSLLSEFMPLEMARAVGLEMIAGFAPLRRYVMGQGLGLPSAGVIGNRAP